MDADPFSHRGAFQESEDGRPKPSLTSLAAKGNNGMGKQESLFGMIMAIVVASLAAVAPAWSQTGADPIGELKKTSTFDRAQHIDVAMSAQGKPVCYFREEGSSHKLDIGISESGAFVRVASGDGPLDASSIPTSPLKVFAGRQLTGLVDGDLKSTGEYEPIKAYDGAVDYVPNIASQFGAGFVVVAKGDPKSFFDVIVRAGPKDFFVVQSASELKNVDIVAVYKFKATAIPPLFACAKKQIR